MAIDLLDQQGESGPPRREETEVRTLLFRFLTEETEHSRDDGLDSEGAYSQPSVNRSGVMVQACNPSMCDGEAGEELRHTLF